MRNRGPNTVLPPVGGVSLDKSPKDPVPCHVQGGILINNVVFPVPLRPPGCIRQTRLSAQGLALSRLSVLPSDTEGLGLPPLSALSNTACPMLTRV